MNWDTKELWLWVTNEEEMYNALQSSIGNELEFMWVLNNIVTITNRKLAPDNRIDPSKVNGNEIYVDFCELNEIETDGWK